MKSYHCCATCRHFTITREQSGILMRCGRLGYETKTFYRFRCWDPRDDIRARMKRDGADVSDGNSADGEQNDAK